MTIEVSPIIAVSVTALQEFGCPHCGYRSGYTSASSKEGSIWVCGSQKCGKTSCVLADGVTKSLIGFGGFYPKLQSHPRRGTPSHGQPDKKPDGGGEFFRSRGIGKDVISGCLVCGGDKRMLYNIAAYVQTREAGERIVAMFPYGTYLDYREEEPDSVQVKVGACKLQALA